jgi:hypothetical protein
MAEIEVKSIEEAQEKLEELKASGEVLNKPSEEETAAAIKEFEEAGKAFNEKRFEIGTPDEGLLIPHFLLDFLDKYVFWTKSGWMGVLKLHEEITETQKNLKAGDYFTMGYQALEFTYFALSNPGGTGLESARNIEKIAENYANVLNLVGNKLEEARAELKNIQWLQDKAAAMQQGFYLEKEMLETESGEPIAMSEEDVNNELLP